MKEYNDLVNYVSNCDDIYCPNYDNCSTDCKEWVECYQENNKEL